MVKSIVSVWNRIKEISNYDYNDKWSLRDFDISIFWLSHFQKRNPSHWAKEIKDFLNIWKNIYFIVDGIPRDLIYLIPWLPEYPFIESNWKKVKFLDKKFTIKKNILEWYVWYFTQLTTHKTKFLYVTDDWQQILWFCKWYYNWNIFFMPKINISSWSTIEENERLRKEFISMICDFDKILSPNNIDEIIPERVEKNEEFKTNNMKNIEKEIEKSNLEIQKLQKNIDDMKLEIKEEKKLQNLICGTWKPLENAVIKALELLWYKVRNYNDWVLEIDQVIETTEWKIFIWECKWKEWNVDIIDFRQLYESKDRFYELESVTEVPWWILFWNTERLKPLEERKLDSFTKKALDSAKASNIILVKTPDLFFAVKYIIDNPDDEEFKEKCREAIETSQWKIVEFPKPTE